jgi:hypothetical protein
VMHVVSQLQEIVQKGPQKYGSKWRMDFLSRYVIMG